MKQFAGDERPAGPDAFGGDETLLHWLTDLPPAAVWRVAAPVP